MISYAFNYHRAASLAEAQALFANSQEAKFLAGGQTLIPAMKQRLSAPSDLIDIGGLKELSFIEERDGTVVTGATTRHNDIAASPLVWRTIPGLAELAEEYRGREVERPEHWGGYRLKPERIEFWKGRPSRLHDRLLYERQKDSTWTITRLAP